jgi:hypothetical protein
MSLPRAANIGFALALLVRPALAQDYTFTQVGTFQAQMTSNGAQVPTFNWRATPSIVTFPQEFGSLPKVILSFKAEYSALARPTAAHLMGAKPNTYAKRMDRRSLEDARLRNFEDNWNKSLAQKYGRYSTSLSDEQKRNLYKTIVRLAPEVDISLVANAAILFWPEFTEVAEDERGLCDTFIPSKPQLEFFSKMSTLQWISGAVRELSETGGSSWPIKRGPETSGIMEMMPSHGED